MWGSLLTDSIICGKKKENYDEGQMTKKSLANSYQSGFFWSGGGGGVKTDNNTAQYQTTSSLICLAVDLPVMDTMDSGVFSEDNSDFLAVFVGISFVFIVAYLLFHNKQKVGLPLLQLQLWENKEFRIL